MHIYIVYIILQFTVEKLGKADSVTTYDDEFEHLIQQVQQIKTTTEKILTQVYSMVQPNPGIEYMRPCRRNVHQFYRQRPQSYGFRVYALVEVESVSPIPSRNTQCNIPSA